MPPIPPPSPRPDYQTPRLVLYQQTHHQPDGTPVSLSPLITQSTGITHLYIAAFHLNARPGDITLNDDAPSHPKFAQLWHQARQLQDAGVSVMAMVGGAARGSFERLAGDDESFNAYYAPLAAVLRAHGLQGVDLDIEEPFSLPHLNRLISRLRADFGPRAAFTITLSPVATALLPLRPWLTSLCRRLLTTPQSQLAALPAIIGAFMRPGVLPSAPHLSGFSHFELEASPLGREIGWYNVQFYNGWGDAGSRALYDAIVLCGWNPMRVVVGVLTNGTNGPSGFVALDRLQAVVAALSAAYGDRFGGVMGWEFFNAGLGDAAPPAGGAQRENWMWVRDVGRVLGLVQSADELPLRTEAVRALPSDQPLSPVASATHAIQQTALADPPPTPETTAERGEAPASTDEAQTQAPTTFSEERVQWLVELGFERPEAIAALEATGGDADAAAGLLFGDGLG